MPGSLAHGVFNIDNNLSVTENFLLVDSIDDLVHGVMIGEEAIGGDYNSRDEERLWRSLYYQTLRHKDRRALKAMRDQVERMVNSSGDICEEYEKELEVMEEEEEKKKVVEIDENEEEEEDWIEESDEEDEDEELD